MYFRLSYVTSDFHFGESEIKVSDPDKGITIVLKQRSDDGERPPFQQNDGLIVAICVRDLPERLQNEALTSGALSLRKEAVQKAHDDMWDLIQRTLRLARWRGNTRGGPNPIRSGVPNSFVWFVDGSNWKMVSDYMSIRIKFLSSTHNWSKDDAEFLQAEILKGSSEPLGHELLREADVNSESNPRSSLILAVAAAEVGFKHFASKALPDTAWLLELPSPPLIDMINRFPWSQLKVRINDKTPAVPEMIVDEMKKAVGLRNKIIHLGFANISPETLDSVLRTVSDFLYFLDSVHSNQRWPLNYVRRNIIDHFKKD
jgi:hypothetical protein